MTHYTIHAWKHDGREARDFGPFVGIDVAGEFVRFVEPDQTERFVTCWDGVWHFPGDFEAQGWSVEATAVLVEPEDETPEDETIILGPAEADALAQQEGYPTADALVEANDRGEFRPVLGAFPRAMRDVDLQDAEGAP